MTSSVVTIATSQWLNARANHILSQNEILIVLSAFIETKADRVLVGSRRINII